jgi:hypothetical protein
LLLLAKKDKIGLHFLSRTLFFQTFLKRG